MKWDSVAVGVIRERDIMSNTGPLPSGHASDASTQCDLDSARVSPTAVADCLPRTTHPSTLFFVVDPCAPCRNQLYNMISVSGDAVVVADDPNSEVAARAGRLLTRTTVLVGSPVRVLIETHACLQSGGLTCDSPGFALPTGVLSSVDPRLMKRMVRDLSRLGSHTGSPQGTRRTPRPHPSMSDGGQILSGLFPYFPQRSSSLI